MKFKTIILFFGLIFFSCNSEKLESKNQASNKDENLVLQQTSSGTPRNLVLQSIQAAPLSSSNQFSFEVGRVVNNENVITAKINELKTNWSKFIADNSTLNLSYTTIEIIKNDEGLFLKGIDENNRATSIIALVVEGDIIYEAYSDTGTECVVTCIGERESTGSGLSGECEPARNDNGYYCSSSSQGTCTKSTTCTDSYNSILQSE
jgi:hypothetical protein